MNGVRNRFALIIAGAVLCSGQSVRFVPDIAVAEAEYRDAQEAWLRNDPNLEKDLFKASPEEVRLRIRREASLRDTVMVKKAAYLELLIQRLQGSLSTMQQVSSAGDIPTDALKRDLEGQQMRILGDQERLEALMRDLPEGDEYFLVRRAIEAEHSDLISLQNNIALRIRSLDSAGKAQDAIRAAAADSLSQKLEAILKIWDQERTSTVRQRTSWAQLYRTMEETINPRASADGTKSSGGAVSPASGTPNKKEDVSRAKILSPSRKADVKPPGVSSGLVGAWVYRSEPGAWSGYGEPDMVTLELRGDGGTLRGTYTARIPVRSGLHNVQLSLEGSAQTATSAHFRWKSQVPVCEGEIELRLASDGRLFVERTRSDDGYVPRGMEILHRR